MERATIFTDTIRGTIAREVYGHFIEHIGRCIYDGVWVGPSSEIPHIEGIRKEAIDVLRAVDAPLLRWPGGYFADCYDWRDGIGPPAERPVRFQESEPGREESNQFGTHEFLRLCELTGAAPNLCVNTATMTAADAMQWVEYCNHDGRTEWAERRRQNGRERPWNVRTWAIGNEAYWRHRPQDYIQRYLLWRAFMRRVDPDLTCIASLIEPTWHPEPFAPHDDWLQEVVAGIRGHMEMASLHLYSARGEGTAFSDEEYWNLLAGIEHRNRVRIESFLGCIDAAVGDHRVKLALDEWGVWHPGAGVANHHEQTCTHRDALFAARYFHLLQRYPRRIGLATVAQSVNVLHALLLTDEHRTCRTPTFHVFEMFKAHQGAQALAALHTTPRRPIGDPGIVLTGDDRLDVVTLSASRTDDRALLTFTNADLDRELEYSVETVGSFRPAAVRATVLAADPHACNTVDAPQTVTSRNHPVSLAGGKIRVALPPASVVSIHVAE